MKTPNYDCLGLSYQEHERQKLMAKMARETGKRMCQALGISTDMDEEGLVKACEGMRAELTYLHAEILSVRESLQRERAGQGKCNSGHVSDRALWDCPVCVEAMRAQHDASEGTTMAAVHALAGVVEGHATSRINFLQRIRQLREIESSWSDMRARLTKAERVCDLAKILYSVRVPSINSPDWTAWREGYLQTKAGMRKALAAWEQANG